MFSIAFVMVSTIAFMEGEEGTEAMVEAYSGESSTISRRVLLSACVLGG
jgi:H+/Cl- antiporter ClcA